MPARRPHLVSGARDQLYRAESEGVTIAELSLPEAGEQAADRVPDQAFAVGGFPRTRRDGSLQAISKRALDLLGAVALAVVFGPVILFVAAALWLEGGSVIYRHRRVGRDGRTFECLKFRTMVRNADRALWDVLESNPEMKVEWVTHHKLRRDPRVTRVGSLLRRTSLDELPQLWNVLRGEMSLVGPRPVVREELMRYGRCQSAYLSARPGITGLWQVTGRNDTDYRRRVALDVYYVRNQSLRLDLYILLKTPRAVLGGDGAY